MKLEVGSFLNFHLPTSNFQLKKMAKQTLECSFCGRKKPETNLLIAGIDSHICDRCIEQAHGIVLEEIKSSAGTNSSVDLILKKPYEIRAFLDQFVIGHFHHKIGFTFDFQNGIQNVGGEYRHSKT